MPNGSSPIEPPNGEIVCAFPPFCVAGTRAIVPPNCVTQITPLLSTAIPSGLLAEIDVSWTSPVPSGKRRIASFSLSGTYSLPPEIARSNAVPRPVWVLIRGAGLGDRADARRRTAIVVAARIRVRQREVHPVVAAARRQADRAAPAAGADVVGAGRG